MSHGTSDTGTGKRDEIPYTVLVVAIKQIAEIEHHLLHRTGITDRAEQTHKLVICRNGQL